MKSDLPITFTARSQAASQVQAPDSAQAPPVVILSYGHSGASLIQHLLADGTDLACTARTGILPLCEVAASTWAQVDQRPGEAMSRLAISSIRALVTTQLTIVLASRVGKRRWCELANTTPSAAQAFLEIFPEARFVTVHRTSTKVISAAIAAQPWGFSGPGMLPFTAAYPGNNLAAVAAYWVAATEQLLAFEAANPEVSSRVKYEDVIADSEHELGSLRSSLHLNQQTQQSWPDVPELAEPTTGHEGGRPLQLPFAIIPTELGERIDHLHAELGYPRLTAQVEDRHPGHGADEQSDPEIEAPAGRVPAEDKLHGPQTP